MPAILVKYSYLWITAAILLVGLLAVWRFDVGNLPLRLAGWVLLVAVLAGILWVVRPRTSENYQTLADVEALIGNGTPTLLELYSEY